MAAVLSGKKEDWGEAKRLANEGVGIEAHVAAAIDTGKERLVELLLKNEAEKTGGGLRKL